MCDTAEEREMSADAPPEELFRVQVIGAMCWSLGLCLSTWYKGSRPFLSEPEATQSVRLGKLHLTCYQWLAHDALDQSRLLWYIRPKTHYFMHLLRETSRSRVNPMQLSNFLDQDHMKQLRSISLSRHPRTFLVTWARRYVLKRLMVWHRIRSQ